MLRVLFYYALSHSSGTGSLTEPGPMSVIQSPPPTPLRIRGNTQASLAFYVGSESKLSFSCLHIQCFYPLSHLSRPLFLASVFPREALCSVPQPSRDLRGLWMSSSVSVASQGAFLQRLHSSGLEHVLTHGWSRPQSLPHSHLY